MKLIIQIPAFNEEAVLAATLREIPRSVAGVDTVEILVVDDGSNDATASIAVENGADHVVRLGSHRGLARAFAAGIAESLARGADIIVNTDADNQYRGDDIPRLVEPILADHADVVLGCRDINAIDHFSGMKKLLQRAGSAVVRRLSGTSVADTTTGFRAFSREAAMRMTVHSSFTYTLETLIQAGIERMSIAQIPVRTNPRTRPSRLSASNLHYVLRSAATLAKIYIMYKPLRVFAGISSLFFVPGIVLLTRFFYYYIALGDLPTGHVQSLIVASIALFVGLQLLVFGLLADLIANNRRMLDESLLHTRRLVHDLLPRDDHGI